MLFLRSKIDSKKIKIAFSFYLSNSLMCVIRLVLCRQTAGSHPVNLTHIDEVSSDFLLFDYLLWRAKNQNFEFWQKFLLFFVFSSEKLLKMV